MAVRAALACAAAVGLLTVAVLRGWTGGVDGPVSRAAVAAALRSPAVTTGWQVLEQVTQPVWFHTAGVLALIAVFGRGRRRDALAALAAGAAAVAVSPLVKTLVDRPRPALEAGLTTAGGGSYPSGHALASATVVLYVLILLLPPAADRARRWRRWAVGAVVLLVVGVDRVWLGAHWPSDVLAGWLFAGLLVATATAVAHRRPGPGTRPSPP
ncbi:phosphatase PAP2 family protein [Kineococcus rubinsiae]|uniref:phosphatase PAP2 family protein n=1 Tax=Kineococcus rubinsiae TaxID=2609562 RepID=UPI00142FFD12|nr:phosphatase PAP2 family protein [Kineococcus rubinsiae]NIZ89830.1 phosphatase PAP2 family protein [Kineococcus rubinsiae]